MPDDVKPGDVLDVVGKTACQLLSSCTGADSQVAQFVLSAATQATRTGLAAVPTPHTMTASDITGLSSKTDQAFHDQWGGVKVRLTSVTSTPQGGAFTDTCGAFYLEGSGLRVGDKVYYRGWLSASDPCHAKPTAAGPATTFTRLDGFSYLDLCTWSLVPNDKCADLAPPSADCASATACAQ